MLLYLVRHAIAFEHDPEAWPDDRDRPLTPEGRRRFRRAARGLRALEVLPDAVLSSRYVRAWQTAEILVDDARWPAPRPCPALESAARPADALSGPRPRRRRPPALVGHEPHIRQLESLLVCGEDAQPGGARGPQGRRRLPAPGRAGPQPPCPLARPAEALRAAAG